MAWTNHFWFQFNLYLLYYCSHFSCFRLKQAERPKYNPVVTQIIANSVLIYSTFSERMNVFVKPYSKTGIPYVMSILRWLCLYLLLSWLKEQHLVLWQVVTFYHFGDFINIRRRHFFRCEVVYRCNMSEVSVMRLWGVVSLLSSTKFFSGRDHPDKRTHYVLDWNLWPHETHRYIHS